MQSKRFLVHGRALAAAGIAAAATMLSSGRAAAQTQPPAAPTPQAAATGRTEAPRAITNDAASAVGQLMQHNGGSLLQATLSAHKDPTQAALADPSPAL